MAKTDQSKIMELLKERREHSFLGNEADFVSNFIENVDEILHGLGLPKAIKVERNFKIRTDSDPVFADIAILHEDNSLTVIEAKCSSKRGKTTQVQAIGQLLYYKMLSESHIGGSVRAILTDWKIEPSTYMVCRHNNIPISLVELNKDRVFAPYKRF